MAQTSAPTQLITSSKANPLPRVLPPGTGLASNSVDSRSSRSSMTQSIVSRMSAIEGLLAKVDHLEQLMSLIASKMDLLPDTASSLVPPTCQQSPPDTVTTSASTSAQVRPPASPLECVTQATTSHLSPSCPVGIIPLTNEGTPSSPTTRP